MASEDGEEWTEEREDDWRRDLDEEEDDVAAAHLQEWIRPRSAGMFQAPSGHCIHVRSVLPPAGVPIVATVAYFHGMNSHVNSRFMVETFFPRLASEGFAVFAADLPGHGYSEGHRALVNDWEDVFDDLESFLEALLGVTSTSKEQFDAGVTDEKLAQVRKVPMYCYGSSMGGMIALCVGLRMQRSESLSPWLKGAVLVCPALAPELPPRVVQCFLRTCVVPLARHSEMPAAVSKSSFSRHSWTFDLSDPHQREIAEMEIRDCSQRFPGLGLGWSRKMLWGTAGSFSALFSDMDSDMEEVSYPFVVYHDPEDKVCLFRGSERLMELSESEDKQMNQMPGKRHGIVYSAPEQLIAASAAWMKQRL